MGDGGNRDGGEKEETWREWEIEESERGRESIEQKRVKKEEEKKQKGVGDGESKREGR